MPADTAIAVQVAHHVSGDEDHTPAHAGLQPESDAEQQENAPPPADALAAAEYPSGASAATAAQAAELSPGGPLQLEQTLAQDAQELLAGPSTSATFSVGAGAQAAPCRAHAGPSIAAAALQDISNMVAAASSSKDAAVGEHDRDSQSSDDEQPMEWDTADGAREPAPRQPVAAAHAAPPPAFAPGPGAAPAPAPARKPRPPAKPHVSKPKVTGALQAGLQELKETAAVFDESTGAFQAHNLASKHITAVGAAIADTLMPKHDGAGNILSPPSRFTVPAAAMSACSPEGQMEHMSMVRAVLLS